MSIIKLYFSFNLQKGKINYVKLDIGDDLLKTNQFTNNFNPFLPNINQKEDMPQSVKLKSRSNQPSSKNIPIQKINLNNANTPNNPSNAFNPNTISQSNSNRKKKIKFYNDLNKMQIGNIYNQNDLNNNISQITKVDFQSTKNFINKISFANCNYKLYIFT